MTNEETLEDDASHERRALPLQRFLCLVVAWCRDDPESVGTLAFVSAESRVATYVLGRGPSAPADPHPRLTFVRQTPFGVQETTPITSRKISRVQLLVRVIDDETLELENLGRCRLVHGGVNVDRVRIGPGGVVALGSQLLLLCERRPRRLSQPPPEYRTNGFGEPDAFGIVGESPAIWRLRQQLASVASRPGHILLLGASGTGKELAARAVHALSAWGDRPLVARNAATIPEGIADAELFGNAKNYPNSGMPQRLGLVGEANGSTLFLDEFAELPPSVQPRLLRVLDDGEYQPLGDSRAISSSFRLVGATNRPETALKHDLLARFRFKVYLPDLNARREDIPLLARHLWSSVAARQASTRQSIARDLTRRQMVQCLVRSYTANVRELESLLWAFASEGDGDEPYARTTSTTSSKPAEEISVSRENDVSTLPPRNASAAQWSGDPSMLRPEEIRTALDEHNGLIEATWRALGLRNRHALMRLVRKYGIEIRRRPPLR